MTTAVELLAQATMKAAVQISKSQGINEQKDFAERLAEALRTVVKANLERVMREWKEATEANLGNAWLQKLMESQAIELAQEAVKIISIEAPKGKAESLPPTLRQPVRTDPDSLAVDHIMDRFEIADRDAAHDILKERD